MQRVKCPQGQAVTVVGLSHRRGQAEQWAAGGILRPNATLRRLSYLFDIDLE